MSESQDLKANSPNWLPYISLLPVTESLLIIFLILITCLLDSVLKL